jgi:hypothetical protein
MPIEDRERQVYLTSDTVKEMKATKAALLMDAARFEASLKQTHSKIAEIDQKLRAAANFVPELAAEFEEQATDSEMPALTDAIVSVLQKYSPHPGARRPLGFLRARLRQSGFGAKFESNPNYIYTALKRLHARGIVDYDGNSVALRAQSPKQEAP